MVQLYLDGSDPSHASILGPAHNVDTHLKLKKIRLSSSHAFPQGIFFPSRFTPVFHHLFYYCCLRALKMESMAFPDLEDLWCEADPDALLCCSCQKKIGPAPLSRTFRLHRPQSNETTGHTKIYRTPFKEDFLIYDRHLECLLKSDIKYTTISHVWDPEISRVQALGRHSPQPFEVRRLVLQFPWEIYRGLLRSKEISEMDEVWCDYISVPQWSDGLKNKILLAVPQFYGSSTMTTIHFRELRKESIKFLYEGKTTDERLMGITDICNLAWFTRTWTAMEFVRSKRVISIDENYDVCPDRTDAVFWKMLHRVWFAEVRKEGSPQQLEVRAEMGKNLVPWNLGPLMMEKGKPATFGQAFGLLSKRRCRSNYDFLHALHGLVAPTSTRPLELDFHTEYARIARMCLVAGDYSPLMMSPRHLEEHHEQLKYIHGFADVNAWPLGGARQLPDFRDEFSFENDDIENGAPILKLQNLGVISQAYERTWTPLIDEFAYDASIVLQATGPDIDSFIETLGTRLYSEDSTFIKSQLAIGDKTSKLARILKERHNNGEWPIEGPDGARWVADAMTLSLVDPGKRGGEPITKLAFVNAHGGTIHVGYAGLNCLICASCPGCHKNFIYRAGLFVDYEDVEGCVAYRIPGLKYAFNANGVGIILKDGRVVGRMVWATPACGCDRLENVKIQISHLPEPMPRPLSFLTEG